MAKGPDLGELRLHDVRKFLDVFTYADDENTSLRARRSARALFEPFGKYTTTLGQLYRVADFFFGPPRQGWGSGLDRLFSEEKKGAGLRPTEKARALASQLRIFVEFSERLRNQIRGEQPEPPRVIRVGAPHTIGIRILASALADWPRRGSLLHDVRLQLALDNSRLLIPQLHAGLLDLVISYGPTGGPCHYEEYNVSFAPIEYSTRMIVVCHPECPLWLKNGLDGNREGGYDDGTAVYWTRFAGRNREERKDRKKEKEYSEIRPIQLDQIDFKLTPLIAALSWQQPALLEKEIKNPAGDLKLVNSYDEALALCMLGQGAAVVPESFILLSPLNPFRLEPSAEYERHVGVYYHSAKGLTGDGLVLVEYLRAYFEKFGKPISKGRSLPTWCDTEFTSWRDNVENDLLLGKRIDASRYPKRGDEKPPTSRSGRSRGPKG